MSGTGRWLGLACLAGAANLALAQRAGEGLEVEAPMVCMRGPDTTFTARVTLPTSAATGATFPVRIDSLPSGRLEHLGLFSIHDMTTDFLLPAGTRYVEGSARVVPGTGTVNVRAGARAWRDDAGLHLALPAHVENGSSYTPPSLEFAVRVEAPPGTEVPLQFLHYAVQADAFLVGTVATSCDPRPSPATLATVRVVGRSGGWGLDGGGGP